MDLILCATYSHKITVLHLYPELKGKVYTMKEYVNITNDNNCDIKDPWGNDMGFYMSIASDIKFCIDKILDKIVNEKINKNEGEE